MPDLTTMMDMQRLAELFKDPVANAEEIRRIGPGWTDVQNAQGQSTEPAGIQVGGGMPGGLSPAEVEKAAVSSGEEKPGTPWIDLLRLGSVGFTDLGNALGNPRAQLGGALYEQNKDYFRTQQKQMLEQRHNMFDDAFKQSQALPQDVMTDPRFSNLASAKAALEKDAADGKIDNEKNVSRFLTEQARVKKDLEDLQLQTRTEQQLTEEERLGTARREREAQRRQSLEEMVANPQGVDPAQLAMAQRELQSLKDQEMVEGEIGGQKYRLPASAWAQIQARKAADEEEWKKRVEIERMGNEAALARERESNAGAERRARLAAGASLGRQASSRVLSGLEQDYRHAAAQAEKEAQLTGQPPDYGKLEQGLLYKNSGALISAARNSGMDIRQGGIDVGGENNPNLWVVDGETYDMSDPQEWSKMLSYIQQSLRGGGGLSNMYQE